MGIKIVSASAKQGAGKSSVSDEIIKLSKNSRFDMVRTFKFANSIYQLHDYILNKMETWTNTPRPQFNKPLLQYLGTEFGRGNYGDDVWVNIVKAEIEKVRDASKNTDTLVIIDDMRFENEFNAFPEALKIRLEASEETRKLRCSNWRDNTTHPSEVGLDDYSLLGKFDKYYSTDDRVKIYHPVTGQELAYSTPLDIAVTVMAELNG